MAADFVMSVLYHLQCLKDHLNSIYHHLCSMCRPSLWAEAGNRAHFQHTLHEADEAEHRTTSRTALQTNQFSFAANIA